MADLYGGVEAAEVGNHGDAESADATMVGYDDLRYGGHTDGVAAQDAIHPIFRRRLEGRSLHTHIDTVLDGDAFIAGNIVGHLDQQGVVGLMHVGKTRACGEVLAAQRMLGEEVDMVGDDHQVANLELGVHAASRIRYEKGLDT